MVQVACTPVVGLGMREWASSGTWFMPFAYSAEYRAMVLDQVRLGVLTSVLAQRLEVSEATIHRWAAQDDVDRGERVGTSTSESSELREARR